MPIPSILQKVDFFQIDSPLLAYSRNIFSQGGEDGIISHIFEIIPPQYNYAVEFGAYDGRFLSNSCNLILNKDWSCLFIEADETKFRDLVKNYYQNRKVICLNKFVAIDGEDSLENILRSNEVPFDFDLLTIDIDGADYFIWESLTTFSPKVVVIEFNPVIPNDIIFVQEKNTKVNQGCSLLALILLGKKKGYELICCTGHNAIFVQDVFYKEFNIPSNSIWNLYRPAMDGRIFHGFDSTIYVVGMNYLMWSNIALCNDDFQVLPESLRKLGGYPI